MRLDVSYDWLILQVPHSVYEGDNVSLRCHSNYGQGTERTIFYNQDNTVLQDSESESILLNNITLSMAGAYRCSKVISDKGYSDEAMLSVKERFSVPRIKSSLQEVTEGVSMTLTCETVTQDTTGLLFAFYRNDEIVQGSTSSDIYLVQAAQLEDSGNYTCEVRTSDYRVKKKSQALHIQIQELFSYPEIKRMTESATFTLKCDTILTAHGQSAELQFAFYRNGENTQEFGLSNKYTVRSDRPRVSGDFTCEVKTANDSVRKRSRGLSVLNQGSTNYTSHNTVRMVLSVCIFIITLCIIYHHVKSEENRGCGDHTNLQVAWSTGATVS